MNEAPAWERRMVALRMRQSGMMFKEIAARFGVSSSRAQQMVRRAEWDIRKGRGHPDYAPMDRVFMRRLVFEWDNAARRARRRVLKNLDTTPQNLAAR